MNRHTLLRGALIAALALMLMPMAALAQDDGWTPFVNTDGTVTVGVPDGWAASETGDGTITITNVTPAENAEAAALVTGFAPGEGEVTFQLRREAIGTTLDAVMHAFLGDVLRSEGILSYSAQHSVTMGRYPALQVIVTTAGEHRLLAVSDLGNGEFAQFTARCGLGDLVALEYDLITPMRTLHYISYTRTVLTGHTSDVLTLAISADGTLLASGGQDRVIQVWSLDAETPEVVASLEDHTGDIMSLDFSANGRFLASGSRDRTARLWAVDTWELRNTLTDHTDTVTSVEFFPTTTALFTGGGGFDTNVFLWGVTNGDLQNTFRGHTDAVTDIAFSPDETMLVTVGEDGTVIRWELFTHAPVAVLSPGGELAAVAYHPEGAFLATAGDDKMITFWDLELDLAVATLEGHTDEVTDIAFSPDGTLLISSSADGTLMLWNVAAVVAQLAANPDVAGDPVSVVPLAVLNGHTDAVHAVAFSPDGLTLASASADTTVRLWDVTALLANERVSEAAGE